MDRTDRPASTPTGGGSQSRLSPVLYWMAAAAILFRVVTAVMDRENADSGAGLVRWRLAGAVAAASRAEGKPILYDFTAAWCAPCHLLDREAWGNPGIARKVNESFVAARVVDRMKEDGKNATDVDALQRRYGVGAFPTLVIAKADGTMVSRLEGWRGLEALERFLAEAAGKERSRVVPSSRFHVPG